MATEYRLIRKWRVSGATEETVAKWDLVGMYDSHEKALRGITSFMKSHGDIPEFGHPFVGLTLNGRWPKRLTRMSRPGILPLRCSSAAKHTTRPNGPSACLLEQVAAHRDVHGG